MSFTFVESNTDFKALSEMGIKRVLIKADNSIYDTVKRAADCNMEIMLWIDSDSTKRKKTIAQHAGRILCETGYISFASRDGLEKLISSLGRATSHICGIIIPVPEVKGLLWNKEIEKLCRFNGNSQIYELFDEETEKSSVRSRYYIGFSKYVILKYMNPQRNFLKGFGIKAVFDISKLSCRQDSLRKMLCPVILKNEELTLATTRGDGRVEKEMVFSENDYVITKDSVKTLENTSGDILLIRPTRGILDRYVYSCKKKALSRIETPSLSAAVEGIFYSTMLEEKGYSFDVADEFTFHKETDFSKYEAILICESCLFEEEEMAKVRALEKKGIGINPRELICDLMAKGEEEWEK